MPSSGVCKAVEPGDIIWAEKNIGSGSNDRLNAIYTKMERYANRDNPVFLSRLELKELLEIVPDGTIINI